MIIVFISHFNEKRNSKSLTNSLSSKSIQIDKRWQHCKAAAASLSLKEAASTLQNKWAFWGNQSFASLE